MDLFSLSDKELGRTLLNIYEYRTFRAELADPAMIDLVLDVKQAIDNAKLTKRERDIVRVHYGIVGGDAISGDHEDKQSQTADILKIHINTVGNNLQTIWEKVGKTYRRESR